MTIALLWQIGMRIGAIHGLDVDDYDPENQCLQTCHRPNQATPLKNNEGGKRLIALSTEVCQLLDDRIVHNRPKVTDDYSRKPLLATNQGRAHKTTIRSIVYRWTRPCTYSGECLHRRDLDYYEARDGQKQAYHVCPSSVSPHAIRRGTITHHLSEDVPEKVVSDRMHMSPDVLERHYDRRTEEEKLSTGGDISITSEQAIVPADHLRPVFSPQKERPHVGPKPALSSSLGALVERDS